jgi:hypothetical protein
MARQSLDIPFGKPDRGHPATVRAGGAIDLLLDILRNAAENPVGVRLHGLAKARIFFALLLAQHADLD